MPLPTPAVTPHAAGRMKWRLAGGAIAASLVGMLWRADEAPAPPGPMPVSLTGAAPLTFAPPAAGPASEAAAWADLKQAAERASRISDPSPSPQASGPARAGPGVAASPSAPMSTGR